MPVTYYAGKFRNEYLIKLTSNTNNRAVYVGYLLKRKFFGIGKPDSQKSLT